MEGRGRRRSRVPMPSEAVGDSAQAGAVDTRPGSSLELPASIGFHRDFIGTARDLTWISMDLMGYHRDCTGFPRISMDLMGFHRDIHGFHRISYGFHMDFIGIS